MIEERRLLTILFADIPGFASLASSLDPEEVTEVVNTCFEFLDKPIVKHGGTIHKQESDLVIALFGYPVIHEDDPERATKAALEMLAILPEMNSTLSRKLHRRADLGLRVGVNSGIVFAGEIGSQGKVEHTVMGDAVNFAARLKDVAKRGEIIVSEAIFRASRYLVDYEALPPAMLKGFDEPMRIFKPLRLKARPEPKRGIKGLSSPMVGRQDELDRLRSQAEDSAAGKRQIAFVIGHPGLGKSRLVDELKAQLSNHRLQFRLLEGRCYAEDETLAYGPFLQIVRSILGIAGSDSEVTIRTKLIDKAQSRFGGIGNETIPYLGYLLSIRFMDELDERVKYLDGPALKVQVFLGIRRLLAGLARERPLVIVIEDAHWIDSVSLELLEYLLMGMESFPVSFVCPARMEKDKEFWKAKERLKKSLADGCRELLLKPLDQGESVALANNLLAIPALPQALQDRILARAEGNPFYLEEIIRSLIDGGVLVFKEGVWAVGGVAHAPETIVIPDTVNAIITARLDRLNRESRDVLQTASVIGRTFHTRILERLSQLDNLMLSLHLATLEDYEYVDELKRQPESEYVFKHPLLQEAVYSTILRKSRRELHRRTGEAIEALYPDRLEDFTDLLAHQYGSSDDARKAVQWLGRAGRRAKERFAKEEAIKYFKSLISIAKEAEAGLEHDLVAAYEALGEIYNLNDEYGAAIDWYQEMRKAAAADRVVWWRAGKGLALVYKNQGRYDDALSIVDEAQSMFTGDSIADLTGRAEIGHLKGSILLTRGEMRQGFAEGQAALKIVEEQMGRFDAAGASQDLDRRLLRAMRVSILNELAGGYRQTGEYDRAIDLSEKALKAAEELGDKLLAGTVMVNLGLAHYNRGDYVKAIKLCRQHLKVAEEIGYKRGIRTTSGSLGMIYYETGDVAKGIEYHEISMRTAEEIGDKQGIAAMSVNLGNIYRDKGEYERARKLYERGVEMYHELGEKQGIAVATGNLGTIYEAVGDFDKAIELFLEALVISREMGAKRRVAFGLDALGVAHQTRGEYEKAKSYLQHSLTVFEEMGDPSGIAMANCDLGGLLVEMGEWDDAQAHLAKAETVLKETSDKFVLISLYRKQAGLALLRQVSGAGTQRAYDKDALQYAEAALVLARELKSRLEEADCCHLLGRVYTVLGEDARAEENFKKALSLFEEMKSRKGLADTYLEYARMLKRAPDRRTSFDEYLDKALKIFQEIKLPHRIKEVRTLRS